jgi:hypothetical protein
MASNVGTGYRTLLALHDDGAGQIVCPLRGLMAIERCKEWQRETAERGAGCTCDVFRAYRGGAPDHDASEAVEVPLEQHLCGRRLDEEIEKLVEKRSQRQQLPPSVVKKTKEPSMPAKPKTGTACTRCSKPPPEGTHIFGGLCKPCRDLAKAVEKEEGQQRIASTARKHAASHDGRQTTIPAVAACEVDHRKKQLAQKDELIAEQARAIERLHWAARGCAEGHIGPEELERLVKSSTREAKAAG